MAKPCTASRQLHRVSLLHSDETASDYFKRSIWLPYVDAVVVHMQDKFSQTSQTALLLPSVLTRQTLQMESFKKVFGMYGKYISCYEEVQYEELLEFIAYTKSSQSSDDQQELDEPEEEESSTCTSLSPSSLDAMATAPCKTICKCTKVIAH